MRRQPRLVALMGPSDGAASLVAAALGLVWWSLFVVGSRADEWPLSFFVATALSVAVLGWLLDVPPRLLGVPMGLAALAAAWSTAPVGDGDGLWTLLLFQLAGWIWVLARVAGVAQATRRRCRRRAIGELALERRPRIAWASGATLAILALWLLALQVPNPWPDLSRRLETFPAPERFVDQGFERRGDPRCSQSCLPELDRVMTTQLEEPAVCTVLEQSLARWPATRDLRPGGGPMFFVPLDHHQLCFFELVHTGGDGGELRVFAGAIRPPGETTEIRISVMSAPVLVS